jgi:transcriptional regulator with GAF, ATPase, and Fis domain
MRPPAIHGGNMEPSLGMIGNSPPMQWLKDRIGRAAPSDSTVLIQGETGAGKELVARAIHELSERSRVRFVALNCAALPETLAESLLYGHYPGSFTGANSRQKGKFELAHESTLFLDEIGELSLPIQGKLLRVLEEGVIDPVGAERPVAVNVRVVAATNRDLKAEAAAGRFRADLYHRLNVITLIVPPLRERSEDIPELVRHFIAVYSKKRRRVVHGISQKAESLLQAYDWPGNVRELAHVVEQAVVMGNSEVLEVKDLPAEIRDLNSEWKGNKQLRYENERRHVENAYVRAGGDYKIAAKILNYRPGDMSRVLRRLDLTHLMKQGPRAPRKRKSA